MRRGRGAPVLGRSNIHKHVGFETLRLTRLAGACCARGRAHSGGAVKMRRSTLAKPLRPPRPKLTAYLAIPDGPPDGQYLKKRRCLFRSDGLAAQKGWTHPLQSSGFGLRTLHFGLARLRPSTLGLRLTLRAGRSTTPVFIGSLRVYDLQPLGGSPPRSVQGSRFKVSSRRSPTEADQGSRLALVAIFARFVSQPPRTPAASISFSKRPAQTRPNSEPFAKLEI